MKTKHEGKKRSEEPSKGGRRIKRHTDRGLKQRKHESENKQAEHWFEYSIILNLRTFVI